MNSGDTGLCAIGVMAKTPQPGRSKTRLCPPLRAEDAAALSAAFLRDTTENIAAAALRAPIQGYVAYAPLGTEASLRNYLAPETALIPADGSGPTAVGVEGFGRCLLQAIRSMLNQGYAAACVLSSDVPTLPTRLLIETAERLLAPAKSGSHRIVLGACDDGGYYILGMTAPYARLFTDIAWSTDSVAETTRARARDLGLEVIELDTWSDVDDAASLTALLHETGGYEAPHTWRLIERLNLRSMAEIVPA